MPVQHYLPHRPELADDHAKAPCLVSTTGYKAVEPKVAMCPESNSACLLYNANRLSRMETRTTGTTIHSLAAHSASGCLSAI